VTEARRSGFNGIILDLVPARYEAVVHGHNLTIGGARVVFFYFARVAVIDVASGKMLASGFCGNQGGTPPKLKTVLAGGQNFVDERMKKIADRCFADMSKKIFRKS